jgi:hypothetical protein
MIGKICFTLMVYSYLSQDDISLPVHGSYKLSSVPKEIERLNMERYTILISIQVALYHESRMYPKGTQAEARP